MLVQSIIFDPLGHMADTDGLQSYRCQDFPIRRVLNLLLQPLGIFKIPPDSLLQPTNTLVSDQKPEF